MMLSRLSICFGLVWLFGLTVMPLIFWLIIGITTKNNES